MCCIVFFSSCYFVRKAPKNKPFLYENKIEVKGGKFTKAERTTIKQRLSDQLDDSSIVKVKDKYIIFHSVIKPPVYDSGYSAQSARNMKASMFHIGYYDAIVNYKDTIITKGKKPRVYVTYTVEAGEPTRIDTVRYVLRHPDFQRIIVDSKKQSFLKEKEIITKVNVLSEVNRIVDSLRNNGYYKFTAAEIRVRGDTTIEALTSVTDDPIEQLRLLAEAQLKKDSPTIKLALVLNPPSDSSKLYKFYVNRIYMLTDYRQGDNFYDTVTIHERKFNAGSPSPGTRIRRGRGTGAGRSFIERYHSRLFRTGFLNRMLALRPDSLFRQRAYYETLNNLSRVGVWQSVNIQLIEIPGDTSKVDMVIELIPNKRYGFQAAIEASYSASTTSSSVVSGNLFGISGNLSLLDRNLAKEGIRMTHAVRAGIELNNNSRGSSSQLINSNEIGYTNTIAIPRLIFPRIANLFFFSKNKRQTTGETFVNTDFAYNNRLNLFNLQTVNLGIGWTKTKQSSNYTSWSYSVRPFFLGFSNLFNETDSFKTILKDNPFLQYSYNTALVMGMGAGFSTIYYNPKHPNSESKERSIRANIEESGLSWGLIPVLNKYKRRYIKIDAEYKYKVNYRTTALAFRAFVGVGVPLLGSDTNKTLPFFKQYFAGGSNSMRGWPVRGIGTGGKPLPAFNSNKTIFNDRTGDMQLDLTAEFRYNIARIIPNALTLRGAFFIDAGNIWNVRNTKSDGTADSSQFIFNKNSFKQLYQQLGVSAGTGFRLDFNYLILRFDLGFRFKRPELYYENDGWKAPPLSFNDVFKKMFSRGADSQYRKWRYENFNFTIGIGYSF